MREIKFRVYDKDLAKYLEGCEIDSLMAELSAEGDGRAVIIKQICPARYIFEQYAGLKDKNGKEIYEGDIVKINGNINYYVDFEHGGFWFNNDNLKWKSNRPLTHFVEINDCEVIGNIHENPELLEGEE